MSEGRGGRGRREPLRASSAAQGVTSDDSGEPTNKRGGATNKGRAGGGEMSRRADNTAESDERGAWKMELNPGLGTVDLIDGYDPFDPFSPIGIRSRVLEEPDDVISIGPLKKIYLLWMVGASCDGCSVAVTGGTHPRVEHLLAGIIPGLPRVELVHTVVSTESGPEWVHNLFMAERGELDAPYVITWEGSIMDESVASKTGGYWMGLGDDPQTGRQITSLEWLDRLAPGAAAIIAIGTCATWGGIPASKGNPTNAMGMMDYLGKDYRSAFGVPVVNIPGCAPIGDNYLEAASATLLFLNGLGPLPEFDELGRPAWLFGETVHRHCPRGGYYEEGVFAHEYGDKECLVEIGCWGPVVQCNIVERGQIDGHGGCMNMGGICIGCTMPGFPDKFSPIYQTSPGSFLSSSTSKVAGGFVRRMRNITRVDKNMTTRWDSEGAPSGWARARTGPKGALKTVHKFYSKYQHSDRLHANSYTD